MTEDALIEFVARAICRAESTMDPDQMWPYEGHFDYKERWKWHVGAARAVLAEMALLNLG